MSWKETIMKGITGLFKTIFSMVFISFVTFLFVFILLIIVPDRVLGAIEIVKGLL